MGIVFGRTREQSRSQNDSNVNMETEEYRTRIDLLYEIAQEASTVSEVSTLLERILRVAQQTLSASAASLLLIDEEKDELYFQVVLGKAGAILQQMRLAPDSGIAGWVSRNGTPVLANDVTTDSHFDRNIDAITGFVTKSIIAVPLLRAKKVIGVLEVLNKTGGSTFNEQDLRVLEGIASTEALILLVSMAVLAINNINSLALDQALLNGYRNTAEAWASAVDTKDSYAYAHSQRVREYTLLAANYLSSPPQELQAIEFGALLHDIGKIGIDNSILCKPGPLTDTEWHIMYEHSRKGANIVGEIPFLEKAKDIILYHHERYDGKGYPEGLKGDSIPLGARLVAVADAFDTMTTDHSYRAALGVDKALSELIEGIGTQFCPVAVEAFVTAFKKREGKPAGEETLTIAAEKAKKEPEAGKNAVKAQKAAHDIASEVFLGDVRLVVPLTVGVKEVRRLKEHLQKVDSLKIVLTGGSEEEGHIILLTLQEPATLIGIIKEMSLVENIDKRGKDIVVTLKNPSG